MNPEIKSGLFLSLEKERLERVCTQRGICQGFIYWGKGVKENITTAYREFVIKSPVLESQPFKITSDGLLSENFGLLREFAIENVRQFRPQDFHPLEAATLEWAEKVILEKPGVQVLYGMTCTKNDKVLFLTSLTRLLEKPDFVYTKSYRVGELTAEETKELLAALAQKKKGREIEIQEVEDEKGQKQRISILVIEGGENFIDSLKEIASVTQEIRREKLLFRPETVVANKNPILPFNQRMSDLPADESKIMSSKLYQFWQQERRSPFRSKLAVDQPTRRGDSISLATVAPVRCFQNVVLVEVSSRESEKDKNEESGVGVREVGCRRQELEMKFESPSLYQETPKAADVVQVKVATKAVEKEGSLPRILENNQLAGLQKQRSESVDEELNLKQLESLPQAEDISLSIIPKEILPQPKSFLTGSEIFVPEIEVISTQSVQPHIQEREHQEKVAQFIVAFGVVEILPRVKLEKEVAWLTELLITKIALPETFAIEPEKDKPAKARKIIESLKTGKRLKEIPVELSFQRRLRQAVFKATAARCIPKEAPTPHHRRGSAVSHKESPSLLASPAGGRAERVFIPELRFEVKGELNNLNLTELKTGLRVILLAKTRIVNRLEQREDRLGQNIFLHSLSKIYLFVQKTLPDSSPKSQVIFDSQLLSREIDETAEIVNLPTKIKIVKGDEYSEVLIPSELLEWEEIFALLLLKPNDQVFEFLNPPFMLSWDYAQGPFLL